MIMRNVRLVIVSLALMLLLTIVVSWQLRSAAQRHTATDTYAITNARIVTVSGPAIDRGTIVIRDGLIAAVGANVAAPPDARPIDGTGLTVYPGINAGNPTSVADSWGRAWRASRIVRFASRAFSHFAELDTTSRNATGNPGFRFDQARRARD